MNFIVENIEDRAMRILCSSCLTWLVISILIRQHNLLALFAHSVDTEMTSIEELANQ
jgi:hypothetical protein